MSSSLTQPRPPVRKSILAVGFVSTTIALVFGSPAGAAPPVYDWSGCYVGGNAGFGGAGVNFSTTVVPSTYLGAIDSAWVSTSGSGSHNATDFLGGGQAGCNLQVNTLVFGIEGDYDYFHTNPNYNNNTNTLPVLGVPFAVTQSLTTNYLATVRPRIGIAADRNLAYLTGGVAFTTANYSETYSDGNGATGLASASKFLVGWAAGAGWEYAITDHIDFRAEYLIAGFTGNVSAAGTITSGGLSNPLQGSASGLLIQIGRAGVNFKF